VKLTKFVILGGAVIALLSFFLPLVTAENKQLDIHGSVSAFQMVKGLSSMEDVVSGAGQSARSEEAKAWVRQTNEAFKSVKGVIALVYAPAALLFLVGLIGTIRGKLGRLGGVGALLFGGVAALFGGVMLSAAGSSDASGAQAGLAIYAMLAGGVLGLVGGLVTIVKPDRGANW
jgi:hypothetical protein